MFLLMMALAQMVLSMVFYSSYVSVVNLTDETAFIHFNFLQEHQKVFFAKLYVFACMSIYYLLFFHVVPFKQRGVTLLGKYGAFYLRRKK